MSSNEVKFSQSAAVTRDRNVKENKLKARQALAKLADEEVTIYTANLEESRHQLRFQLVEQNGVEVRQTAEAQDVKISAERKEQLNTLVERLTAIKSVLRFQEEALERELAFKGSIRQKRAAFQVRLARLEQRQAAERVELQNSQSRLAQTVFQIRAIEIKSVKDKTKVRRMKRENELTAQQVSMRQQKESEFLRELQLCKARQMGELNDLELNNMEEIEDITTQQRQEEFELLGRQQLVESEIETTLTRQKSNLEANQLLDKQKVVKASLQRAQRKQAKALAKAQRLADRNREKTLLAENEIIRGDANLNDILTDDGSESATDSQSEGTSRATGSQISLHDRHGNVEDEEETDASKKEKVLDKLEVEKNSALNKDTQVLSEAEKELLALVEAGNERNRNVSMHHKKILAELRQQHRSTLSQKTKEHRRKVADLLKDHEEEIEQIKAEQANTMKELMDTHLQSEEIRADTGIAQNLLGMMLPGHIMEKIETGVVPDPESFSCVSVLFTDIYDFKKLTGVIAPVNILKMLNILYTQFDAIIAKYPQLYKVESVSDTYMVASGLSSSSDRTKEEISECTIQALQCCMELQALVKGMNFVDIVGTSPIQLRIGIHSGTINAGLIGTKMSRYCLFGDTVNTASRMCTTGEPGKIQVSPHTIQVLGEDDQFEFTERGEIEVKGKGKMRTYWLLD
ncbi:adenylate and guanylate cyclase catalytic domain-containing protein [Chytriomyces sp. MP71]|nr:adenylate and guanylate cyclase catalytic domain-containing protein [Chytriomyces sp. MP71]